MRWQITSGSANLNQATLTTPKHAKITKNYFFPKIAKGAASLGGRIFPRTKKFATTSSTSSCPKWCSVGSKTCSRLILDNVSACTGGLDGLWSNAAWQQQYLLKDRKIEKRDVVGRTNNARGKLNDEIKWQVNRTGRQDWVHDMVQTADVD